MVDKINKLWDQQAKWVVSVELGENSIWDVLKETLNYDEFAEIHKASLEKLRVAFPIIPDDLSNKSVIIKYSFKDKFFNNRYLVNFFDDWIELKLGDKRYYLCSNGWNSSWSCYADKEYWTVYREKAKSIIEFDRSEFEKGLADIINNADKCDWLIKTRDWKNFSYKDFLWNDVYRYDANKKFS